MLSIREIAFDKNKNKNNIGRCYHLQVTRGWERVAQERGGGLPGSTVEVSMWILHLDTMNEPPSTRSSIRDVVGRICASF